MRRYSDTVNMVNAPYLAKERGLDVREVRHDREGVYHTLVRVTVRVDGSAGELRLEVPSGRSPLTGDRVGLTTDPVNVSVFEVD